MTTNQTSARFCAPIPREDRWRGDVLPSEESASLLLWIRPCLLSWSRTVNWLFSPVVGNKTYVGDLWGLNARGDLLILETKLDRTGVAQDPFEDFVNYATSESALKLWTASSLKARWLHLVRAEYKFIKRYAQRLCPNACLRGIHRGVLPYSEHRDAVWRWQHSYRHLLLPKFMTGVYLRAIERSLRERERRQNPAPVFAGVVATVSETTPRLSSKGLTTMRDLQSRVGCDRVLLRRMHAKRSTSGAVRVQASVWDGRRSLGNATRGS